MMKLMIVGLASTLAACGSAQRSRTLQTANARLDSQQARQLEATQPQLVREAHAFAKAARKAEDRGDIDMAELKAQQSIQRFETAVSLDGRSAAEAQMRAMQAATGELGEKVADLDREREALEMFRSAEARFQSVEAELAQVRADDQSAKAQAQRAIVAARRKQAEAVGVKAPTNAPDEYNRATTLLTSALAALESTLFADAQQLAEQARDGFDQALAKAQTEGEKLAAGAAEKERKAGESAREKAKARDAVDAAEVARAAAVANRLPQRDATRFEQGDAYLNMAQARLKDGDYAKAIERANASQKAFEGKAELGAAAKAIQQAEEARGRALGMGLGTSPQVKEADYTLNLAKDALQQGDAARAEGLAKKALNLYASARPAPASAAPMAAAAVAGPVAAAGPAAAAAVAVAPVDLKAAFQAYEVERALVGIRHARADALAAGRDAVCPSLFKGFEAFVELAEDRHKAGNNADAMQFATRASERLAQCNPLNEAMAPPSAAAGGGKAVVPAPVKAAPEQSAADRRAQQKAESALVIAKRLMIRARTRKVDAVELEEPELLIEEAQRWYARKAFVQADALADEATKLLRKIKLPKRGAKAPTNKVAEPLGIDGKPAAGAKPTAGVAKSPTGTAGKAPAKKGKAGAPAAQNAQAGKTATGQNAAGQDGAAPNGQPPKAGKLPSKGKALPVAARCMPLQPKLNGVRQARSLAAAQATTKAKQDQYIQTLGMLASVEGLIKDNRCKQAEPFLEQVRISFKQIISPTAGGDTPVATAVSPAAQSKECKAVERRLQAAYVAQGVASARISDANGRRQFERAVADLVLTKRDQTAGKCKAAKVHLDRATAAFDALSARPAASGVAASGAPAGGAAQSAAAPAAAPRAPTQVVTRQTVDPATRSAIDKAASLQRRARAKQGSSGYQTGAQLLGKARDLANVGRDAEAKAVAEQAQFAFSTATDSAEALPADAGADASEWKPVYAEILDTLVLRDRARPVVKTDTEQSKFQSANAFMNKARTAWKQKDYLAAKRFTAAAKTDYQAVLGMVEKRTNKPVPAPKPVVTGPDPKLVAQKNAALERLRAVELLRGRCLERDCRASHPSDWGKAEVALQQAAADQAKGDWAAVQAQADTAHVLLSAMLKRPTFVMPADTSGIRKVGNQLMLTPPVTFTTGGGAIEPSALPTINALADLLKQNDAAVVRLRIVGHTDSRGSASGNQRLSERRANTVRTALIDLGVSAAKISAEGMGEANPIASNKTAAGRERNRRVEFLVTVKQ